MSDQNIRDAIAGFFRERGKSVPAAEVDILESGIIDSMELIELVAHLEKELGLDVPQDRMTADNFRSIAAVVRTLRA